MVTTLRVEGRLDGSLNFRSQKTRVPNILEESEVDDYVNRVIPKPTDDEGKSNHKKNEAKEERILINLVKYHQTLNIAQLKRTKKI